MLACTRACGCETLLGGKAVWIGPVAQAPVGLVEVCSPASALPKAGLQMDALADPSAKVAQHSWHSEASMRSMANPVPAGMVSASASSRPRTLISTRFCRSDMAT